jgi:hypothetical protein
MIRSNNLPVIRVIASLLNLYRAMDAKHPSLDVGSIISPHPVLEGNQTFAEYQRFCSEIFPKLVSSHFLGSKLPPFEYESALGLLVRTAGANLSGPSSASATLDAQAWSRAPRNYVLEWFRMHKDYLMAQILEAMSIEQVFTDKVLEPGAGTSSDVPMSGGLTANGLLKAVRVTPVFGLVGHPILSRLHAIDEPAGKVRVVAICDYWTQAALKPVHEHLFTILRGIASNDATFDQDGIVNAYFQRGLRPHWSFDLKTATDSIPLGLYKEVLVPFLSSKDEDPSIAKERVNLWASILTDRDFYLPVNRGDEQAKAVRYGTGQPMGALSSWASMALVHHSLVQFAHYKATLKEEWFTDYLILGDDVDIASSQAVATAYKEVCADFSITIGLAKSLQSEKNCFEFANRRYVPEGDISPLSFREELACSTWTQRSEFAKRILRRIGKPLTEVSALLRRAVTSAQWTVLAPEMSGRRPSSILRLVYFCLLNPLQSKTDREGLSISSVLDWLTNVLPEEDIAIIRKIKVDSIQARNLGRRLVEHLREKIFEELSRKFKGEGLFHWIHIEEPLSPDIVESLRFSREGPYGQNAPLANNLAGRIGQLPYTPACARSAIDEGLAIIDEQILLYRDNDMVLSYCPPLSPVSWYYFRLCVYDTNRQIMSKAFKLWDRADDLAKRLPPLSSQIYERDVAVGPTFGVPLGEWLQLWVDVLSLPKVVPMDLSKSVNYNLDYNSTRSYIDQKSKIPGTAPPPSNPEAIFGPLLELATTLAEFAGVRIPNLPFFGDAVKGKRWTRTLSRTMATFKVWKRNTERIDLAWQFAERLQKRPVSGSRSLWEPWHHELGTAVVLRKEGGPLLSLKFGLGGEPFPRIQS